MAASKVWKTTKTILGDIWNISKRIYALIIIICVIMAILLIVRCIVTIAVFINWLLSFFTEQDMRIAGSVARGILHFGSAASTATRTGLRSTEGARVGAQSVGTGLRTVGRRATRTGTRLLRRTAHPILRFSVRGWASLSSRLASRSSVVSTRIAAAVGRSGVRKIPLGVGLLVGGGFAIWDLTHGDREGAALNLASGGAAFVPVIGTGASIVIDVGIIARICRRVNVECLMEEGVYTKTWEGWFTWTGKVHFEALFENYNGQDFDTISQKGITREDTIQLNQLGRMLIDLLELEAPYLDDMETQKICKFLGCVDEEGNCKIDEECNRRFPLFEEDRQLMEQQR